MIISVRHKNVTDYSTEAVRKALANTITYRDYGFRGSILVSVFDFKLEIVLPSRLYEDFSIDDLKMDVSSCRSEKLVLSCTVSVSWITRDRYLVHHVRIPEGSGQTEVRGIRHCVQDYVLQVHVRGFFRGGLDNTRSHESSLEMIRSNVETALGVSRSKTYFLLKELEKSGSIESKGKGRVDDVHLCVSSK